MRVGLRIASGIAPAILLLGGWSLGIAPGSAAIQGDRRDQPVFAEIPASVVARELEAARERAGGGGLSPGHRVLEALTSHHAPPAGEDPPLLLTPQTAGLLARNGMQAFLRDALAGAGGTQAYFGDDETPPTVEWISPSEGADVTPESALPLAWRATDANGIYWVDFYASFDGGATFLPVALYLGTWQGASGGRYQFQWYPPHRPGPAILRLEAIDFAFNVGSAEQAVTLTTLADSLLPTTLRDFDAPGTQPFESFLYGSTCTGCHSHYDRNAEPYFPWAGSMMAGASLDPLFEASLTIARQDAVGSGDQCIRCHVPQAWLAGRATPSDGSQIYLYERTGVSCELCHQLVDPVYAPGVSPVEDLDILANLADPPTTFGNGSFVLDPYGTRRGPFAGAPCAHYYLTSPFHQEAELCAACHDQSNLVFEADGMGGYTAGTFDQRAASFGHGDLMPVDRTYSEWLNSDYNSPEGVYAPEFGGNRDHVSTCQDCHMRDVTGSGCAYFGVPVRDDQPFHDLTGGNTWMPGVIAALYPFFVNPDAADAAEERARYMLKNAASLATRIESGVLEVKVTNETGHKLPTGYPHGRRMWLNVRFYDSSNVLIGESGRYDLDTGDLIEDPEIKVYGVEPGLDTDVAGLTGLPAGPSFHSVLNNRIYKDNRIPPRGFTNAAFAAFGGGPVGASYADGQYWDVTTYTVPPGASRVTVKLYYQTTSKEYVEFLRAENHTDGRGQRMYDLWNRFKKCRPALMSETSEFLEPGPRVGAGRISR